MIELSPTRRRALRAQAHHLHPVVSIAANGLSEAVMKEIRRSLAAHGLIKIRVFGAERAIREAYLADICTALDAAPVQHIGNLLVVYREPDEAPPAARPATPRPATPKRPAHPAGGRAAATPPGW
jgi:putative YhbY family RNA-binding protein